MATPTAIWIWAEQRNGHFMDVSLEVLGAAQELADTVNGTTAAVVIGDQVADLAKELVAYGADIVYAVSHPDLALYQSGAYPRILAELIEDHGPEIVLMGSTSIGMEVAPAVAARLKTGLTAHCCELELKEKEGRPKLIADVPGWGGGIRVQIVCNTSPQMVTVGLGVTDKPQRRSRAEGTIVNVPVTLSESDLACRTVFMEETPPEGIPVEQAETVLVAGAGMKAAGGVEPLKDLAGLMGAAVGGTRPVVDQGWIPQSGLIGASGKSIGPKLLITVGTSGANHYVSGITKAEKVLAINKDPNAAIFNICDMGIVADLTEVLPLLQEELTKQK
ncbi:MAG: electron transfer flavoprotein subunit alpha/FixB family protein [Actinobacteria bacterium]|nr:electron transfer flavoprotein subunit alpha/FixB family protein [Actinomycetota bacterium]